MRNLFKLLYLLPVFLLMAAAVEPIEWLGPATHDFGDIIAGEPVTYQFEFRNNTDEPLLIENVRTSCGCTSGDWENKPVLPDSIGKVDIEYDARSNGYFRKSIKVYFNNRRGAHRLWIAGFVEAGR